MGLWVSHYEEIGSDTPPSPAFDSPPNLRCNTGPMQEDYLSNTCAILDESMEKWMRHPQQDTISKRCCVIWWGISNWAAKTTIFAFCPGRTCVRPPCPLNLGGVLRAPPSVITGVGFGEFAPSKKGGDNPPQPYHFLSGSTGVPPSFGHSFLHDMMQTTKVSG